MKATADALLRHVYLSPLEYEINERLVGAVDGELRISHLELQTALTNEGEFVAHLTGYIKELVDEMSRSVLDYIPTWDWPER
jgi:hypothetical protein